jgi:hypothetical protein
MDKKRNCLFLELVIFLNQVWIDCHAFMVGFIAQDNVLHTKTGMDENLHTGSRSGRDGKLLRRPTMSGAQLISWTT